jgi:hypothetical protein
MHEREIRRVGKIPLESFRAPIGVSVARRVLETGDAAADLNASAPAEAAVSPFADDPLQAGLASAAFAVTCHNATRANYALVE